VLTFAIVASQTGRPLESAVLELFRARAGTEVPFPPDHHLTWTNDAGTIWFAGWQAHCRGSVSEPHWHQDADRLTAFAGRVWPRRQRWTTSAPVATQLAEHLDALPLEGSVDELAGVYIVASMARRGRCSVTADPLGIAPLHWGQSPDIVVLSTRAAVAAALLATAQGTTPTRDAFAAGWLAYTGQAMGACTAYEQISLVPAGCVTEIEPTGAVQLRRPARPPWRLHADELASDPDDALNQVRVEMTTAIRTAIGDSNTAGCLGLTGGKDSRLILALLLAEGSATSLEYQTLGGDDLPDVAIARQLAESFGLHHVTNPSIPDQLAWRRRVNEAVRDRGFEKPDAREILFRITAWATSGTRNVGEPHLGRLPSKDAVLMSGLCGEGLRTNYHHSTRLRSKEQAALFPDAVKFGATDILRRDALAYYRAAIHELLFDGTAAEDSPQDVIDAFYLRHRLRRWLGPTQEVDSQSRVFPLYSITAIRLAFAIGAENRHAEWIHYRLMRAACEPLVHVPFAGGGWPRGANRDLVHTSTYDDPIPTAPPPPPPLGPVGDGLAHRGRRAPHRGPAIRSVAREFRARMRDTDVAIMRGLFRHDSANPAFDLIDATAAQRALDRFDTLTESQRLQLYGALSAVIWLGEQEIELPRDLSTT
jgi:hypothetical protein